MEAALRDLLAGMADLIDEANDAHEDSLFIPDVLRLLGVAHSEDWYADAAETLRERATVRAPEA